MLLRITYKRSFALVMYNFVIRRLRKLAIIIFYIMFYDIFVPFILLKKLIICSESNKAYRFV